MRHPFVFMLLGLFVLAGCAPVVQSPPPGSLPGRPPDVVTPGTAPRPAVGAGLRVGMLVPLSGSQAGLGQSLLEAAQLALYESGSSDVALITQDTGGEPAQAARAAQQAVRDGASLLIGPVFSAELESVKPVARAARVPVVSLSNNAALADPSTFILGLTPGEQITRVMGFAGRNGITRVGALVPRSAYGDAVMDALSEATGSGAGLSLVHVLRYDAQEDPARLAGEFVRRVTASGGVQAVLLPETGERAGALATALYTAGLDPRTTRLLGTALWQDAPARMRTALSGGWYAGPDETGRRAFTQRYQRTYGSTPASIAPLAYDATALAGALAKTGGGGMRGITPATLTRPQGFAGTDGLFRFTPSGIAERSLAVFEIAPDGLSRSVDTPPRSVIRPQ